MLVTATHCQASPLSPGSKLIHLQHYNLLITLAPTVWISLNRVGFVHCIYMQLSLHISYTDPAWKGN